MGHHSPKPAENHEKRVKLYFVKLSCCRFSKVDVVFFTLLGHSGWLVFVLMIYNPLIDHQAPAQLFATCNFPPLNSRSFVQKSKLSPNRKFKPNYLPVCRGRACRKCNRVLSGVLKSYLIFPKLNVDWSFSHLNFSHLNFSHLNFSPPPQKCTL